MAKSYRQPRRFNSVTLLFLALFAAAGYWMWVFFPAYWDAWTVDHLMKEAVSELYQTQNLTEPEKGREMRKILKKVQADAVRLAHVNDPDFDVSLDLDPPNVILRASYKVVIRHPIGNAVSTIQMKRVEKANIKKVSWD
jgi:hypothetical protein